MLKLKGTKLGMSQVFAEDGKVTPVTLIKMEEDVSGVEPGTPVKVTGVSKGKGFAGVIKRWGFKGGPKTHGQSDRWRAPGSIGGTTDPARVFPGKKMPGRMGGKTVTVWGLEVAEVAKDENIIKVSGSVPGPKGGKLKIFLEKSVLEQPDDE